ncbi:hypothetical protein J5N97_005348 [Dioscorea zingiberensis]|uniref:Uncharacterized protein n=1 Tax=Dioscorea zingiberensis TaxID=325984 RepID=A0A9D5D9P2_9LILI|nr:hypothetical protein J5N97_005348 [Dioscorea zingiberensis]
MAGRYKRATAPLDESARARLWVSGEPDREIRPGSSPELAELVDSFYDEGGLRGSELGPVKDLEKLEKALSESGADPVAKRIQYLAERVVRVYGSGADGLNPRVVIRLRDKGFDAGVCTSVWEGRGQVHACKHEYVDVIANARYIVETNLKAEFQIARPTAHYISLLEIVPKVFVGMPETLRMVVQIMCAAAEKSMKRMGMHVPPWRRPEYVQAKWFSPHERCTSPARSSVRRKACRVEMVNKVGPVRERLAMASEF